MTRKIYFLAVAFGISFMTLAQQNMFTLSGGYTFANFEYAEEGASGFRINGLYEFNLAEGRLAHGLSIGYIQNKAEGSFTFPNGDVKTVEFKVTQWPIYYAPKYFFMDGDFKPFVKGAVGLQFSSFEIVDNDEGSVSDAGFYGGLGAGAMYEFGKLFVNVEYEWAFASNSYYQDDFINSIMGGIGMRF